MQKWREDKSFIIKINQIETFFFLNYIVILYHDRLRRDYYPDL